MGCRGAHGGELSTEQLSEVVAREQGTLEECYQTSLEKTPYEHEFRIEAKLSIRRDGSVSKVELDQNGLQGMGPCVERTIRAWQFPKAKAETYAGLPIIFRPKVVNPPPESLNLPPGFRVLQDNRPKP
jgi:hypothetical protein